MDAASEEVAAEEEVAAAGHRRAGHRTPMATRRGRSWSEHRREAVGGTQVDQPWSAPAAVACAVRGDAARSPGPRLLSPGRRGVFLLGFLIAHTIPSPRRRGRGPGNAHCARPRPAGCRGQDWREREEVEAAIAALNLQQRAEEVEAVAGDDGVDEDMEGDWWSFSDGDEEMEVVVLDD